MNAPLRVLWLADKLGHGDYLHGIGRYYLSMIPALRQVEVIPGVLRISPALLARLRALGLPVQAFQHGRWDVRTLVSLCRRIRRDRIHVLHVHGYGASFFGRLAGWLTGIPVIMHQHDQKTAVPAYVRLADRLLARQLFRLIAVSESVRQFCLDARAVAPEQTLVWHNAVPPRFAYSPESRAARRQRLGLAAGQLVVGIETPLTTDQGLGGLLEAIQFVLARRPGVTILLWGTGTDMARMLAHAERLGLGSRLRVMPPPDDLQETLALLDCFVLPTVSEGSSFSLLEALAAGLPMVATAVGGTMELLTHEETGLLVPSREPQALAQALLRVLDDAPLRARLSHRCLQASAQHEAAPYAARLEQLYRDAAAFVAAPRARRAPVRLASLGTLGRYALVGCSGLLVHLSVLTILVEGAHWPVLAATTLGFAAAVCTNFVLNRHWTFRSAERNVRLQFVRFTAVSLCGLAINTLGMGVLAGWAHWPYVGAQMVTLLMVWLWNFLANTYWSFQPIPFKVVPPPEAYAYDLSIVIPAYNEEQRLGTTLEAVDRWAAHHDLAVELIVVDDGSADRTLARVMQYAAQALTVRTLHQPLNQGKGAAVRAGCRAAQGAYLLMMDADHSIPIDMLDAFWPARGIERLLIASRYSRGHQRQPGVSWQRYWIGRWGNDLVQAFLLPGIRDTQCGFKLFSHPVAQALIARQRLPGFGFDLEWLAIARALGLEILELPVRWTPVPGSTVRPVRDAVRALGELMAVKANLWSGLYHLQPARPGRAAP